MSKKFIITESDKSEILKMYGLISEQLQLPQTVQGTFQSNNEDSAHNLGEMEKKIDDLLPKIYSMGINPKMYGVSMSIKKLGNNTFTTTYSVKIDKSDDNKAWMGFASRGSIGNGYEQRADGQISGTENKDGRSLEDKLKTLGGIEFQQISNSPIIDRNVPFKQYFIQFTKQKYPPIGSNNSNTNNTEQTSFNTSSDDLDNLNLKFKSWIKEELEGNNWSLVKMNLSTENNNANLNVVLKPDENGFRLFSILFNPKGSPQESKNNALSKNPGSKIVSSGDLNFKNKDYEYHLIGIK